MIRFDKSFNVGHLIIFISSVASFGSFYALTTYKIDTLTEVVAKLSDNHLSIAVLNAKLDERLHGFDRRLNHLESLKVK